MTPQALQSPLRSGQGLAYGLLGLPLAFVALPLYVLLPNHYAREFGMPLATLGGLLLAARLLDAVSDPLLGRLSDHLFGRSARAVLAVGAVSAVVMALGLTGLFFPPVQGAPALTAWAFAALVVTYLAYSQLGIAHQSWGARLGGDELQRSRIVAWREGAALVGVVLASLLPALAGLPAMLGVFALALSLGWWAWSRAPRPATHAAAAWQPAHAAPQPALWRPWQRPAFRRLLAVFVLNGIASAIPATLVLFFIQDLLQAPPAQEPLFLGIYFVCAAVSIPLWLRAVARFGLARTWLAGMLLAIAAFSGTALLGAGDVWPFALVCALSGVALGTDLALPSALLAGVIAAEGDSGRHEGAYFGWWNLATKLNLALAAGLALPLLGALGYAPGTRSEAGLQTLSLAYAVLPCALKLMAAVALYALILRRLPAGAALPLRGTP
ncbi:MFS transporter [Acidovorax sp. Leaf76]|uniref:MFS transporter n=1 Tax=unclassified Acidovorax TaxID=2684926 RepID=UPI0006FF57B8|nr:MULTISPECIES: MFS transporter [unclassified Acidovorax]KQO26811.1 MFS transporter [Acidovorax sp. Leaf76]KQO40579.1 MFS transporter [Acidovorax sp. Leaf84]KQS42724.1 MFS transporter [Acidovorax sp. Leaf191]